MYKQCAAVLAPLRDSDLGIAVEIVDDFAACERQRKSLWRGAGLKRPAARRRGSEDEGTDSGLVAARDVAVFYRIKPFGDRSTEQVLQPQLICATVIVVLPALVTASGGLI